MTVALDAGARAFIDAHASAAMVTLRPDGTAHAARIGLYIIDGRIWSSGTQTRKRTAHLRADPRATLFVFDGEWRWLTLECTVRILDGDDAPGLSVRMFQQVQARMDPPPPAGTINWFGRSLTLDAFREAMVREQRLIYEFDVVRAYGMYGQSPAG